MKRVVLATGNPHKAREIAPLVDGAGIEVVPVTDLVEGWHVEESGRTLLANARLKAGTAVERTGLPGLADDTGLFVDAIDGAPGVRSARYAGDGARDEDNVARLLARLENVPTAGRTARFRCVALLLRPDGEERAFEGILEGRIAEAPRGEHGFGYDPVFEVLGSGATLAELEFEEKNRISHRAMAMGAVAGFLGERSDWIVARQAS